MKTPNRLAWFSSMMLAAGFIVFAPVHARSADTENAVTNRPASLTEPATAPFTLSRHNNSDVPPPLPAVRLSPWAAEIAKLAQAGVEDEVIFAFIDNSGTFNLSADQIIHLNQLGVSSVIISAMLQHDNEIISGVRTITASSSPPLDPVVEMYLASLNKNSSAKTGSTSKPAVAPREAKTSPASEAKPVESENSSSVNWEEMELLNLPSLFEETTAGAKPLYRLREPEPVELTSPIVLIRAQPRPANTYIVIGFPKSEK